MTGRLIVFEGCDASGKTTQAGRLVRHLLDAGHDVVATFEPGATPLGRSLRELLLESEVGISPVAEALLMAADRAQHVAEVIGPALARGAWVVSDRFVGSSLAYQGAARGVGVEAVARLNQIATGGLEPDLVFYLAVPVPVLLARRSHVLDRIERAGDAFLDAVVTAYEQIAVARRWIVVDGTQDPDAVEREVRKIVEERLGP